MGHISAELARIRNATYSDERNRPTELTTQELEFFRATVAKALAATGITISVETRDHDELPGHQEALGIYYKNDNGDHFITIDNYFIHERYRAEVEGWYAIEPQSLTDVICHELAHIKYKRHTRYHAELTAQYANMVA